MSLNGERVTLTLVLAVMVSDKDMGGGGWQSSVGDRHFELVKAAPY
jgi:hypothetical protein